MILEKVYDELYGMIEDLKKKIQEGTGGSTVTITPTLESGVKLADYSIDGTEGAIYAPPVMENYSATPQVVGKWIDDRDVMRKVVEIGALPNNTTKNVAHEISDLDTIVSLKGYAKSSSYILPLPYVAAVSNSAVEVYADDTNISLLTGIDRTEYTESYIIVDYVLSTETRTTKKKK